jgi:hypothetical protein
MAPFNALSVRPDEFDSLLCAVRAVVRGRLFMSRPGRTFGCEAHNKAGAAGGDGGTRLQTTPGKRFKKIEVEEAPRRVWRANCQAGRSRETAQNAVANVADAGWGTTGESEAPEYANTTPDDPGENSMMLPYRSVRSVRSVARAGASKWSE